MPALWSTLRHGSRFSGLRHIGNALVIRILGILLVMWSHCTGYSKQPGDIGGKHLSMQ